MKLLLLITFCCVGAAVAEEIVYNYLPTNIRYPVEKQIEVTGSQSRVVGGINAPRGMFPYMVRLHLQVGGGFFFLCGASLISLTHILGADHCIPDNLVNIDAYLGVTQWQGPDLELHPVGWFVRRGQGTNPFVDLAIFGLPHPVIVKLTVAPVVLPRLSQVNDFFLGREGLISGWGGVDDGWLKYIPIRFVPTANCGTSIGMLCSAGRDSFNQNAVGGDSGGPVVLLDGGVHVLVGCLSFGFNQHIGATHVPQFLPWINQVTGILISP